MILIPIELSSTVEQNFTSIAVQLKISLSFMSMAVFIAETYNKRHKTRATSPAKTIRLVPETNYKTHAQLYF